MLLHGWGLNAQVWDCITPQLASHFTLHLVDLPGYGRSGGFGAMSLEAMAQRVLEQAPPQAVWLGWSLGGWWPARSRLCVRNACSAGDGCLFPLFRGS